MKNAADSARKERRQRFGDRVLLSWAEIADFAGRTVRTVQRWEEFYDFPVHRDGNGVHALPLEIDGWMAQPLSFRSPLDIHVNRRWNRDLRLDAREAAVRSRALRKQAQNERAVVQRWHKRDRVNWRSI